MTLDNFKERGWNLEKIMEKYPQERLQPFIKIVVRLFMNRIESLVESKSKIFRLSSTSEGRLLIHRRSRTYMKKYERRIKRKKRIEYSREIGGEEGRGGERGEGQTCIGEKLAFPS